MIIVILYCIFIFLTVIPVLFLSVVLSTLYWFVQILQKLSPSQEKDECKAAIDPVNVPKSRMRNILPGKILATIQSGKPLPAN